MSTRRRIISTILVSGVLMMGFSLGAVAQKKVVVWHFGGLPAEHKWVDECVETFNADHPGIKVEKIEKSWMTKTEELISAWAMKTMPDVISRDTVSIPDMVEMGMLAPVSDLFSKDIAAMKDRWIPECWVLGVYKGKVYGINTYMDMASGFAYHRPIFAKAGLTLPTTWDELIETAKKLTTKEHYGIVFPATLELNDVEIFEGIAYANGGRFLNPEGDKILINGKGWVDALQLYVDLFRKHKVTPPGLLEIDYMKAMEILFEGRAAMAAGMSWFPVVGQNLGVDPYLYKLAAFPKNPNPSGAFSPVPWLMDGTTTYMLISTSKVKGEAWEFIKWVTRPESMKMWAGVRILGRVPTTYVGFETPELAETYPDLVALYKKGVLLKGALIMPSFPGWLEMVKILGHGIQEALLGIKSPQQALNDAQAKCQEILEEE